MLKKYTFFYLGLVCAGLCFFLSCDSSVTGPESGDLNLYIQPGFQVSIEDEYTTADDLFQAYFGNNIADVVVTITGEAMNNIEMSLDLQLKDGMLYSAIGDIPSGARRSVSVELVDADGSTLYDGTGSVDINGGKTTDLVLRLTSTAVPELVFPESLPVDLEFVFVNGGSFMMGSEGNNVDESPVHYVTLSSYYISTTEVTNAMYAQFLNASNADSLGQVRGRQYILISDEACQVVYEDGRFVAKAGYEDYPVVFVYSQGAIAFCSWLGMQLPTEAQWEFAARGGVISSNYLYAGSNDADEVAWYDETSNGHSHPVAQKTANELGLYDMSGNVWELCRDGYSTYSEDGVADPVVYGGSSVIRGGCWFEERLHLRSTNRDYLSGGNTSDVIGFRCALGRY